VAGDDTGSVDHLGSRRLSPGESWFWYLLAGSTYIGFSMFHKFLLNWIIGPVWLIAVIWAGPMLVDRLRGRP
jgi:hypothetical protein